LKNIVVKLVTRPTIKGKRQFVPVNPKHNYPGDTVFILRWLPEGTTTYRTKTLPRGIGLKMAQMACASFEPPTVKEAKEEEQHSEAAEFGGQRSAFLLDKNTTFKKDGTPLDADTIHSYELVTAEFIKVTGRTKAGQITKQDMRNWIIKLKGRMAHRSVCNLYILVACFLKFCGIDHKTLLPQLIEPQSDPLVLGDRVDARRDDAICHLESVLSSHHVEEKITDGQRSRYFVRVAEQEYVVQNPTDKPAVFIVHHEIPENWIVDSDPQPASIDGSTAVFRLVAEPGQRVRLHVGMHRSDSINPN